MWRLLPLLSLALALPVIPSDKSSVSSPSLNVRAFQMENFEVIQLISPPGCTWLHLVHLVHLVTCSYKVSRALCVLSDPECTQQSFQFHIKVFSKRLSLHQPGLRDNML